VSSVVFEFHSCFQTILILLRGNVEQYGFQYEDNTNQKHSFVELSFITD